MATKTALKKPGRFYLPPVEISLADPQRPESGISQKIELIRCGTFHHPEYGVLKITPEVCRSFVKNFSERVRKVDLAIDYKHASEDVAAGWIKNIYFDENSGSLYAEINWTSNGKRVLVDKEFRYVSAEFNLEYQDSESLKKFGPTLLGAGLTNRPFIKGMEPVVPLSEGDGKVQVMSPEDMTKAMQSMQAAIEKLQSGTAASANTPPPGDQTANPNPAKLDGGDGGDGDEPDPDEAKGKNNKPGDPEGGDDMDLKKQLDEANAKIAALTKQCDELTASQKKSADDMAAAEKKKKFDVMLSEKKVVEAQREPFMKGDMDAFTAAAQPLPKTGKISLSETQAGGAAIDAPTDPQQELIKLADKLVADKKATPLNAMSMVLADPANKELRIAYEKKSYNRSFVPSENE